MRDQSKALFRGANIRKAVVGLAICAMGTSATGQVGEVQLVTEPQYASGYLGWLEAPGVDHYEVNILQDDGSGNVTTLATSTTTDPYTHIDPSLFTIGDTGYEVLGMDANGSIIYDSGEVWPAAEDPLGTEIICEETCVGNSYAWRLVNYGQITSQSMVNGNVVNNIGHRYLKLQNAFQFYDNSTGDFTPYWQAVSDNGYSNMVLNGHPYTREYDWQPVVTDGLWSYSTYRQEDLGSLTQGGPFYDENGFSLTDGRIIQKRLDEFHGFHGVTTSQSSQFDVNNCTFSTQGWINFFNLHNTANMTNWPANLTWFNGGTTPNNLACVSSGSSGGNTGGGVNGSGPIKWWKDLYAEIKTSSDLVNTGGSGNTWNDFVKHHESIMLVGGGTEPSIVEISIKSITAEGIEVGMEKYGDNELRLTRSKGELVPGLYQVTLFTDDGNAVLGHYGIDFNMPQADDNEFVTVSVSPNPIQNGQINVTMDFVKDLSGQLIVHDINGNILHSEAVNESRGEHTRRINVQNQMVQLFVSLVLADGSLAQVQILNI